jgi:hypothetical protein
MRKIEWNLEKEDIDIEIKNEKELEKLCKKQGSVWLMRISDGYEKCDMYLEYVDEEFMLSYDLESDTRFGISFDILGQHIEEELRNTGFFEGITEKYYIEYNDEFLNINIMTDVE